MNPQTISVNYLCFKTFILYWHYFQLPNQLTTCDINVGFMVCSVKNMAGRALRNVVSSLYK